MSDVCRFCEVSASRVTGLYQAQCLDCCTRLVLSAHPNKAQAATLLAALTRFPNNPGRAAILESVARCLEKSPCPGPKSITGSPGT